MKDNAMIKIITVSKPFDGGLADKFELETLGRFSEKDGKFYIVYEETELTGFQNTTTMVKIFDDGVILKRSGDVSTRMEFAKGEKRLCSYQTPYGAIPVATELNSISGNLTKNGGKITISYTLDFNNEKFAVNTLDISVNMKG